MSKSQTWIFVKTWNLAEHIQTPANNGWLLVHEWSKEILRRFNLSGKSYSIQLIVLIFVTYPEVKNIENIQNSLEYWKSKKQPQPVLWENKIAWLKYYYYEIII